MWDLALDPATGDLLFGPSRDLLGVTGFALVDQRILNRAKIPRGSFRYDDTGTLGSNLNKISSSPLERQLREAPALLGEAIEPMRDINVQGIDASVDENRRLSLVVRYSPVVSSDAGSSPATPTPDYDATVTI